MRTNLVTGGAGFLGRHLVRLLVERGEEVRALDLRRPERPPEGAEFLRGSVTDTGAVREAVRGAERVFHLAAVSGLWAPDPGLHDRVNRIGTRTLLEAAGEEGVSVVVHTSTELVLRSGAPAGPYSRSKRWGEAEARAAAGRGPPVVIVRPTVPVGPGDRGPTPPTRMLLGYLNGRWPGYLEQELDLVDVRDLADGHLRAAERGRTGEPYLLAGTRLRLGELLRSLEEITGLEMPSRRIPYPLALAAAAAGTFAADHLTGRPPAAPLEGVRLARLPPARDDGRARRELGFRSRPLRTSLTDAIRWFRREGLLEREPRRPLPSGTGDERGVRRGAGDGHAGDDDAEGAGGT